MWSQFFSHSDFAAIVPEIIVAMFGLAILLLDFAILREKRDKVWNAVYALAGLAIAGKDKGQAENESEPVDPHTLMP